MKTSWIYTCLDITELRNLRGNLIRPAFLSDVIMSFVFSKNKVVKLLLRTYAASLPINQIWKKLHCMCWSGNRKQTSVFKNCTGQSKPVPVWHWCILSSKMHLNLPAKLPMILASHYACVLMEHNSSLIGQSWPCLEDSLQMIFIVYYRLKRSLWKSTAPVVCQ